MLSKSFSFLRKLVVNNHKEWFDAHRGDYMEAKQEFETFLEQLISGIRDFDPTIGQVTTKDCVYRIYRDLRFSPDKTPYKNYFGAYIASGGRKSELAGYYFHIEPAGSGYINHSIWSGGLYSPDPLVLKAVRTDIYEMSEEYKDIIENKEFESTFQWFNSDMLRTVPKGFPKDFPDISLIKRKDYAFFRNIDEDLLKDGRLLEESLRVYRLMLPLNRFINRAIQYHLEND
jgi:uncharacterized protein (TIGR02453 family)